MANEIKFVFVGDTADYDKAVNDVIKKANKAKEVDKEANRVRKQAVNLEKLLKEEYHGAAKNAGSLKDITKKLADEEGKRLKIAKQLSDEALTQKQRQGLLVDMAKSQARSSGLRKAGLVGLGKLAATTIVGALAAGAGAAISGTVDAINQAQSTRQGALQAGQTVEQFQINKFAASLNRKPEDIAESLTSLGVIIDEKLNKQLSDAGHQLSLVGNVLYSKLIPAFAFAAKKIAEFGIDLTALIQSIMQVGAKKTVGAVAQAGRPLIVRGVEALVDHEPKPTDLMEAFSKNRAALQLEIDELFGQPEIPSQRVSQMKIFSDSLSRIGLFKSGADSQRQIQKASLGELKQINKQTRGLKETVRDA